MADAMTNENTLSPTIYSWLKEAGVLHDHECRCGTATHNPHEIGEDGCRRLMSSAIVFEWDDGRYFIDGSVVSEYTFLHQRGFYKHPCGCYSQWQDSVNSLRG